MNQNQRLIAVEKRVEKLEGLITQLQDITAFLLTAYEKYVPSEVAETENVD